jgi:tetratricopeptide (TPR) repeat protein
MKVAVRLAAASAPVFLSLSHLTECQTWCTKALAELDEDQRDTSVELELQGALGISMMFTRGNSPAAGTALSRALEIATALDDRWNQLCMLGRLHIYHERIGEYAEAMAHARRAVEIAEMIGEDEALSVAYSLSGISHHLAGDQIRARHELQLALDKSPPSQRRQTIRYGFDHRNRSGIALARTLWLTGAPEQAELLAHRTADEAARLNHPVTHSIALIWSLAVHLWMGDHNAAQKSLDAFAECAQANALGPYIAATGGFRGELGIQQGETEASIRALEESLSRLRAARYELLTTSFSMALARGLIIRGQFAEAYSVIDATIARCDRNGERYAMPELLCVKAQVVRLSDNDLPQSEDLLHEAVELARQQGARAWELRAASELAQLHTAGIGDLRRGKTGGTER